MTRIWIVSMGDTHAGLKYGLLMPETEYHEEGPDGNLVTYKPQMTETQQLLSMIYDEAITQVQELSGSDPVIVIHGGDLCHGQKHPEQLQTTRLSDQVLAGVDILDRWFALDNLKGIFMNLGTESHNAGEGSTELLAAGVLREAYPDIPIDVSTHWLLEIGGVTFDLAHHGAGSGIRYWTAGNAFLWYLRSLVLSEVMELGNDPPDVVLRYHYHTYSPVTYDFAYRGGWRQVRGFVHPAMCGMNYYGVKVTRSRPASHLGLLVYCIEDGRLTRVIDDFVHVIDRRTKRTVVL